MKPSRNMAGEIMDRLRLGMSFVIADEVEFGCAGRNGVQFPLRTPAEGLVTWCTNSGHSSTRP